MEIQKSGRREGEGGRTSVRSWLVVEDQWCEIDAPVRQRLTSSAAKLARPAHAGGKPEDSSQHDRDSDSAGTISQRGDFSRTACNLRQRENPVGTQSR